MSDLSDEYKNPIWDFRLAIEGSLMATTCFSAIKTPSTTIFPFLAAPSHSRFRTSKLTLSVLRPKLQAETEVADVDDDVLRTFFKERQSSGDFITKTSDLFWQTKILKPVEAEVDNVADASQEDGTVSNVAESGYNDGFLKLSSAREWALGSESAPANKKVVAKALQDDRERRKKLNFLKYEALKRELTLVSVGVGIACSGYCLIVFSLQAAISYATGVLFSCLYLQLLYQHADNLSKEMVPEIFLRKKSKKIGITSEDVENSIERFVKGSSIALSSPRLVIPAAIYALSIISHKYLANGFFDFQLVPAMCGMFVYKAAALVQVYRDNEELKLIFPENDAGSE